MSFGKAISIDYKYRCVVLWFWSVDIALILYNNVKIDNDISAPKNISSNPKSLFFQPIIPPEVYREINKLNLKKAAGPENIPLTFYKRANECISNFLCLLYNKCIENGFFPSPLKQAKVIPIYKSGKRYLANNYRPISLLSPISKIFESLTSIRLISFLEDNNIISEQQFGFRKQHSTTHVVTDVHSQISKNLDNKQHTCVILLDFRKAFDTVNHQILLRKLEKYGIRGNVLEMFQSYLTNRVQFVYVNGYESDKMQIKCGVPQGSCLGPTLFSLYINDLPDITNFRIRLFADDTVLVMTSNDLQQLKKAANDEILKIEKWLLHDKSTLNYSKTNYMLFSPQKECGKDFFLSINGQNIHRTAEAKYLGVYLDEKLKWDSHIQHLCKKLSQYCGLFCHLRHNITQELLLLLYHSLVYPHLLYGILTWGSTNNSVLHPLQVLQNRLIRIICRVRKLDHITNNSLYHKLSILKIKGIYHLEMAKFMYLHHNNKLPKLFNNYFKSINSVHSYNTRHVCRKNYQLYSIHSNIAKKALPFSGAQVWNSLLPEWKDFSYYRFKKTIKSYFVANYS